MEDTIALSKQEPADMDSDDDFDTQQTGTPAANASERRRARKAILESWLISSAAQEALTAKVKHTKLRDVADEDQSIHSLMANQSPHIIKNPRDYQRELFERAKKENTIAVLDTGSGKTLIAVLLLRWIIDQELENREAGRPPRISFFLVASVTLVYQQFSVLFHNLDHPVARVCGADKCDNWQKSKWLKHFSENKVIVCTADILHQCLAHSYITMKQINLLIFDEAHHAKKNHAYARIIKDFYLTETDPTARPRVFGMTASPIDAKSDVEQAANELETLLHCRIATTLDMSLTDAVKKPAEHVSTYNTLSQPFETKLLQATKARFGHIGVFKKTFDGAPEVARELGAWCADRFLMNALSEKRLRRYEVDAERKFYSRSLQSDIKELDQKHSELRVATDFIAKEGPALTASLDELSSKVRKLRDDLHCEFESPSSHRCIVFVNRRHTARLLAAVFQHIGTQHLRPAFLIGSNVTEFDDDGFTFRQQVMTLIKFRKDEINCLFATSVAEEGLDVPDCNLIIRFDICSTMIQYVQSRGRARQRNSRFLHMIECGNSIHTHLVSMVRYQENTMRKFCRALPEDRRLVGNEDCLEELMSKEKNMRVYTEPETGAKLTYGNALAYLANYVSTLPGEQGEPLHPTYILQASGSKFICEVLLPGTSPGVRSATGRVSMKKSVAKRSAAFEACIELRRNGKLDQHLMSTHHKMVHAMRNALLAANLHKKNQYLMRTKPSIWEAGRGTLPTELWITVIAFPDGLETQHQPIALLTRTCMPDFPSFPVFLNDSRESKIVSRRMEQRLQVTEQMLRKLSAFTFRVFKDVFSKTYEDDASKLSYWFAPLDETLALSAASTLQEVVDWALLDTVFENDEYKWKPDTPNDFLANRFLVDRWDGGRKFYSIAVAPNLKPQDAVPENTARGTYEDNILDYSISLWKKARERAKDSWNPNQPVMKAVKYLTRRNMLATPDPKETVLRTQAYLCPEPLRISALPPAVVTACLLWPAIIYRFDSYLIALEACDMIGIKCSPKIALEAVTKDSDNSGDHDEEQRINFQKGMGDNYERLEFIGDTFLKTATTIATFIRYPDTNQDYFHNVRMVMLCNDNLFQVAEKLGLYEYVRSMAFSRRLWYPKGLKLLEGKGVNMKEEDAVIKHTLGQKTIADVCEALIGAAFVTHDKPGEKWQEDRWQDAIQAVTKLVSREDHTMTKWSDYRQAYEKAAYQTSPSTAAQRDLAEKVALEHPYRFTYPRLLRSAFLHSSQPLSSEKIPCYERLEFLGDGLLDMASITHLFYRFPDKDPQWLTEHKMAMVSNKFLGAVCINLGFHRHLRYEHSALESQIREYATELLEAKRTAGDSRDYWTTVSDPPKCLPDIVESYVGAMFIDSDFDYNVVQDFFDRNIKWYFEDMSIYDTFANNHPCTHLHNLLQMTYGCQDYQLMARELPPTDGIELDRKDLVAVVMVHDEIVAFSKGKSGRYARVRAANNAIEVIQGLAPYEFRSRYGCQCHEKAAEDMTAATDCGV